MREVVGSFRSFRDVSSESNCVIYHAVVSNISKDLTEISMLYY